MESINIFECGCAKCNVPGKDVVNATIVRQLDRDFFVALCSKCSNGEFKKTSFNPETRKSFTENTAVKAVRVPLMESSCVSCLTSGQIQSGTNTHYVYWSAVHIPGVCEECSDFWALQNMYLRGNQRDWVDERYNLFKAYLKTREVCHKKVVVFA